MKAGGRVAIHFEGHERYKGLRGATEGEIELWGSLAEFLVDIEPIRYFR